MTSPTASPPNQESTPKKKGARKKAAAPSMTLAAPKTPPAQLAAQRARRARAKARRLEEAQQKAEEQRKQSENIAKAEELIKEASHRTLFCREQVEAFSQLAERFTQEGVGLAHHLAGLEAAVAVLQGLELPCEAQERLQTEIDKVRKEGEALAVRREVMNTLKQKFAQQADMVVSMSAQAGHMVQQLQAQSAPSSSSPRAEGGHIAGKHPGEGLASSRKNKGR